MTDMAEHHPLQDGDAQYGAVTTAIPAAAAEPDEKLDPALLRLAGVLVLGLVAAALDTTMVNVAIDKFGHDLHATVSTTQWVSTGYLLSYSMVIPLSGWLSARIGTKNLWLAALTTFVAASVLCGVAGNIDVLIAFRIVQGAGGGMMLVLFQAVLVQAAGPRRLGRIMSITSVPAMLAPIIGPIIGGLIVTYLSWRWIFYVNVPTCVTGLILAWRVLPRHPGGAVPRLDAIGLILLAPALAAIIYGLSEAGVTGSFTATRALAPLCAGIVLVAAFTWHSLSARYAPIIDLHLMRLRSYASAISITFIMGFGLFASLFILPLFYQEARGQSALDAGLLMAPQGAGFLIGLAGTGKLTDRINPRPLVLAGTVLTCLGTVAYTQVTHSPSDLLLGVSLFVRGIGMSVAIVPTFTALYFDLDADRVHEATSAQRIFQQVGASFGTAVLAVILQKQLVAHLGRFLPAFGATFWWALGLSAAAALPALFLPRRPTEVKAP